MGRSGAASTHLHFNLSPDGRYSSDINPFDLLKRTSGTACAAPPPPPAPVAPPPAGCGNLLPGQQLNPGQSKVSCDGRFTLVMQGDGNLVLYQQGRALWNTQTNGRGGHHAVMQSDGNFVLYVGSHKDGTPVSQNHSPRGPHARDGYFVPDVMLFCPV
jgi:hypothetical protein